MIRWKELYQDFLAELKSKLAAHLTYHCWEHTAHVVEKVAYIGAKEQCSDYEIVLMKTAALFHDAGYINSNENHEDESIKLAREILPKYGYSEEEISQISGMIAATKIPQQPKNKLESIVADADLEYLGSEHFIEIGTRLYQEFKHFTPELNMEIWNDIQINFLQTHQYHTDYCKKFKAKAKEINLQLLLEN